MTATDSMFSELATGLAELKIDLSTAQSVSLLAYVALIAKWNKTYSLTAIREPERMVSHHLLDSLAPLPHFKGEAKDKIRILDVGSGFGTPGIPLAIVRPDWQLFLLDSNHKKTTFLRQVIAELKLTNVTVLTERVELYKPEAPFQIITSRAFAELAEFVKLTQHLLAPEGEWAALKGVYPFEEIAHLPETVKVTAVDHLKVPGIDAERHLVHVVKV
ncbi:16S rRNA (guanine(527)-N(7))-methyltransferase RsmG [Iodobacter sp. LRB]|uniref:Ribosomal RNA small subunit methyltransferase G n=1 Tax=Iodobacter violaceini TaxID=3044271 RepID=A0ABX0KT63_9NEIS|nr:MULTISPECIES: 16S rRNA (guanine(527)-N(7))-methyltransferase RsmG [Iodobacter]NHQ87152.1 16S rRNA (guanine(527)-N(7))-methyltransferase RsmG [Iodobacter violacea]PHV03025.1 16S rRNA (guanine(527)-N(7))-methyltransferase RsmG [Iodobacter sp. BJB302]